MWAPLLEKAWAKVKGTFSGGAGGFMTTGIRAITGAPVKQIKLGSLSSSEVDSLFDELLIAD